MTNNSNQQITNPLDLNRLVTTSLELAVPETIPQLDMLESLQALTPQQRTELLADWCLFWLTWHTQFAIME